MHGVDGLLTYIDVNSIMPAQGLEPRTSRPLACCSTLNSVFYLTFYVIYTGHPVAVSCRTRTVPYAYRTGIFGVG